MLKIKGINDARADIQKERFSEDVAVETQKIKEKLKAKRKTLSSALRFSQTGKLPELASSRASTIQTNAVLSTRSRAASKINLLSQKSTKNGRNNNARKNQTSVKLAGGIEDLLDTDSHHVVEQDGNPTSPKAEEVEDIQLDDKKAKDDE